MSETEIIIPETKALNPNVSFDITKYNAPYPDTRKVDVLISGKGDTDITEIEALAIINQSNQTQVYRSSSLYNILQWQKGYAPINSRILYANGEEQKTKVNNKIQHDILSEVIDKKAGYMSGKPVSVTLRKGAYPLAFEDGIRTPNASIYDDHADYLRELELRNNMNDVRLQTTKYTALIGVAGRLLSGDTVKGIKIDFVQGFKCAFYGQDIQKPEVAIYNVSAYEVRYYDAKEVIIYVRDNAGDDWSFSKRIEHHFGACPLIPFFNNDELQGDVLTSLSKINDIDERSSDLSSEMAQTRVAPLFMEDIDVDLDKMNASVQMGYLAITTTGEGKGKAYYPARNFNTDAHETLLTRTRTEIYRDCKTADFSEIIKSGTSGETRKWSLLALENNASATELKLRAGEMRMWELICNWYNQYHKGSEINYLDIQEQWSRDLPAEIKTNMESTGLGWGKYPISHLYKQDPNVENPDELAREFFIEQAKAALALKDLEEGRIPEDGDIAPPPVTK